MTIIGFGMILIGLLLIYMIITNSWQNAWNVLQGK